MHGCYGYGPWKKGAHFRPFWKEFLGDMVTEFNYRQGFIEYDEELGIYTLKVELPGIKKEDLKVKASKYSLKVEITQGEDEKQRTRKRKFRFRREVDPTNITATYRNGLLEIKVPVVEKTDYTDVNVS